MQEEFSDLCLKVTPDLLLDQGPSAEMSSEEEEVMQTIYNILRQGYAPTGYLCNVEVCKKKKNLTYININ